MSLIAPLPEPTIRIGDHPQYAGVGPGLNGGYYDTPGRVVTVEPQAWMHVSTIGTNLLGLPVNVQLAFELIDRLPEADPLHIRAREVLSQELG